MNFDSNVRGATSNAGYVIRGSSDNLLVVRGSRLFEPSILVAELRAA